MKLNVRVVAAAAAVLGVAALVLPATVGAQKVQNPGTFALQATGGQMVIGGLSLDLTPNPLPQCSDGVDNNANGQIDLADPGCSAGPNGEPASSDDSELVWGFQPKVNVSITGSIDGAGKITIPTSGVVFPPAYVAINLNGVWVVRADVLATEPATGTLDPLTGAAVLNVKARIKLSGNVGNQLPSTCSIGTTASPVSLNLITGRKEALPPNNAITGAPYNTVTGTALLVDNAFAVPGATGCALNPPFNFPDYGPTINQQVGIPSAAGNNAAVVAGKTAPVLTKAINPVITSSVPLAGNEAPFDVTFSGASSTLAKGPATYSWEFSDGTTATGAYVDKTFNAGNQSAKLTVTDADGDKSSVTSNFVVAPGSGTTTTTTTASTTTTTASTTTTTASTTTTTASTTTTTTPTTTTTTTPTTTTTTTTTTPTTTTTTTTTPTTTTTSTTIPQPSDDAVQVRVNGAVNYVNGGSGNGDLAVQRDSSGIRSVTGFLDIPGTQGGDARASVSIQRAWILPLWTGQVSVRDQAAGVNVSAPVFGQVSRGSTANSAKGTSNWFIAGTFPNLFRPYSFSWEVIDAD